QHAQGPGHAQLRAHGPEGAPRGAAPLRGRVGGPVVAHAHPRPRACGPREPAVSAANGTATGAATTRPFRNAHVVVHEVGEGPAVGYLHGLVGNPSVHPFLAELAAVGGGQRVVAPGLPGFSGSPACEDLRSMHDWVVATSEIVDLV